MVSLDTGGPRRRRRRRHGRRYGRRQMILGRAGRRELARWKASPGEGEWFIDQRDGTAR